MSKMVKRILSMLLCAALLFGAAPLNGFVGLELPRLSSIFASIAHAANPTSGACGTNLTWNYDMGTKTLTINGTGEMSDYAYADGFITSAPWQPYCQTIESIVINNNVTSVGKWAFCGCAELTSVTMGNSVASIGEWAFCDCEKLKSITIPDSVTSIEAYAFESCDALNTVFFGSGVTMIGDWAFESCDELTDVYYNGTSTDWSEIRISEDNYELASATVHFVSDSGTCGENLKWYYYDDSNTLIINGTGAMTSYSNLNNSFSSPYATTTAPWRPYFKTLQTVVIEDGVTSIGASAFYNCRALSNVTIPDSVIGIEKEAFYACKWLTSVDVPDSVTSIGASAFSNVANIVYCGSASGSPWGARAKNGYIEYPFVYSNSQKTNLLACFTSCQGEIIIPDSVRSIGGFAFVACAGMTGVTIPDSVTSIGGCVFSECSGLQSVTIPNSITSIGNYEFDYCTGLKNIIIPDSVTSIGEGAFRNCRELNSLSIPNGVTSIQRWVFDGCSKLASVTIPNSVSQIGYRAFFGCDALMDIYYVGTESDKNAIRIDEYNDDLLNANWHYNPNPSYPVLSYDANEGDNAPDDQTGATSYTIPSTIPIRFGYNFLGWSTNRSATSANYLPGGSITISTNTVLYAVWNQTSLVSGDNYTAPITYRGQIYYYEFTPSVNGKYVIYSTGDKDTKVYLYNTSETEIANNDDGGDNTNFRLAYSLTGGTTYYYGVKYYNSSNTGNIAVTFGPVYTVSYNANGCSGAPSAQEKDYGKALTLSSSAPSTAKSYTISYNANGGTVSPTSKTVNCSFTKWKATDGTVYSLGASYTTNADTTMTAQWTNPTAGSLATPTKDKYTFDGWYTSSSGGSEITSSSVISGNITVFAHWTPIPAASHTVTYNYSYNGGTSATKTTATVEEGAAIDLTPTATKSGWTFVGWHTDETETLNLDSLTMGESNVTLYAIYKKTLTGTFIDYSGTTKKTTARTVVIYNKATSGTLTPPTQNTYSGWSTRGWAIGTTANASVVSSYAISSNTTFYGLYQRTLTLSYNANGGSPTPPSQTGTQYVNSYSISTYKNPSFTLADKISKTGSTFAGWAKGSTSGTVYNAGDNISISENTTMHAKWEPITHSVTYNYSYNGGTSATKTTATVEEGAAIDLTPTASKSGWTFVGWHTDETETLNLDSLTMGESNVTLYAIYKKTLTGTFIDYSGTTKTTRTSSVTIYNQATGGTLTAPSQNTYSGWTNRGWTKTTTADASPLVALVISSNTTFYCLYEKTITLSYNANGGSPTPASQTGTIYTNSYSISNVKQASFTLAPAINKSNCIFNKWAMNSTSGVKYDADSTITISANTTMYATWIIDTIPSVVTEAATDITKNAATLSGRITSNGGHSITSRKIIYYEKLNPSSKYTKSADESFTVQLTNLKPSTEYCFQAVAVSEKGTGSGEVLSFKTKDEQIVLPNRISVSPTSLTLEKGKTRTLFVTVLPTNANNSTVTWTSNNETVATVVDGVVYARSKGNAKITVRTNANGLTAVCNVSVTEMNFNISPDFSEINMGTNCSYRDPEGFIRLPHKGGNSTMATAYLARWDGAVLESNDRYPDPAISTNVSYNECNSDYHVQDVLFLPARKNSSDNNVIKEAIMDYGAVYASFDVNWNYFDHTKTTYYLPNNVSDSDGGHAIAIIGWDDNYSKYNFVSTPPGNGAFICKNSWGSTSGENGYFYISYYDQQIGYRGVMAVFANLETKTNYNKIYQYDPLGPVSAIGYQGTTWVANVFPEQGSTLSADEKLCAASFYTYDKGTSYELYVVTNYTDKDSLRESRQLVAKGVIEYAGYHTIPFKEITLKKGTRFAIVVKMSLPDQYVYCYYEAPVSSYYENARANAGESFYSTAGTTWSDLTSYTSNANFCVKAFTNAAAKRGQNLLSGIDNAGREYEDDTVYTVEEFVASGGIISEDYLEYYYNSLGIKTNGEDDEYEPLGSEPDIIEVGDNNTDYAEGANFPTKYDLRNEGCVSSVKNQGSLGLCWTFATYASLESCLLKKRESMSAASSMEGLTDDEAIDALINDTNVELNSISLEKNEYVFKIGEQRILEIDLTPRNAAYPGLIWTSSDNSIVMVDTGGMITGIRAGTAMIEATTEDGRLSAQCFVRIAGIEPMSTAVIDYEKNLITGIQVNLNSLTPFIQVTDDTCSLQYQSIGTGKEVYLTRDNEIVDIYTIVVFGDVDGNGWYDGTDAFYVNCIVNGLLTKDDVGDAVWLASDCNHDGKIDQADVSLLESAGLLLADVDQTATIAELESNSAYQEYISLVDQSFDSPTDNSNNQTTPYGSESNDSQLEDEQSLSNQLTDSTNKKSAFVRIYILIVSIYKYIFRFLFGLVGVS